MTKKELGLLTGTMITGGTTVCAFISVAASTSTPVTVISTVICGLSALGCYKFKKALTNTNENYRVIAHERPKFFGPK